MNIAKPAQSNFLRVDYEPDYAWTENFDERYTGLLAKGFAPEHKRPCAVLGFGCNGIAFSMLVAKITSLSITSIVDQDLNVAKMQTTAGTL